MEGVMAAADEYLRVASKRLILLVGFGDETGVPSDDVFLFWPLGPAFFKLSTALSSVLNKLEVLLWIFSGLGVEVCDPFSSEAFCSLFDSDMVMDHEIKQRSYIHAAGRAGQNGMKRKKTVFS
jgi:hypothetical protein